MLVLQLPLVCLVIALGFFFGLVLAMIAGVVCDDDVDEVYNDCHRFHHQLQPNQLLRQGQEGV